MKICHRRGDLACVEVLEIVLVDVQLGHYSTDLNIVVTVLAHNILQELDVASQEVH
jgi:hypothetical protein